MRLTGAGGVGKTRIALRIAARVLDAYADGVCVVELASVRDAELVVQAAAAVLGVAEQSGMSLTHTLAEYLQFRHLFLVLDNAEHLIEACAQFVDVIVRRCSHVDILATSRALLGVHGELA